ncbi:MAG: lactoylglutathione lyase [Cyanobacteria bacterium K_DeepCast_35m_m1_288]|nr:lactoylglutathione lyase [Cyanobacteria bacterium K_DeepCast_35m_m1_288]
MSTPYIRSIGFTCRDAEALASFYTSHLGCRRQECLEIEAGSYAELIGLPGSRLKLLRLKLGAEQLELLEVLELGAGLHPGRFIPADSRSNDLWFQHICVVVSDMAAAAGPVQILIQQGQLQSISSAPQTLPSWNQAAAGIQAFKFHDPEGHCLELLQFPQDKGEPRWHQATEGSTFLGIDHSAIANADTPRSCRFYEELLGLRLGGDGVNSGIEQDHLDGLSETEVRITGHRCPEGPGIECLNYLQPAGGRPLPADQNSADIAHWQIRLAVSDLEAIASQLESYGGSWVSPGIVELSGDQAAAVGFSRALQVRDPDGHQLQIVCS